MQTRHVKQAIPNYTVNFARRDEDLERFLNEAVRNGRQVMGIVPCYDRMYVVSTKTEIREVSIEMSDEVAAQYDAAQAAMGAPADAGEGLESTSVQGDASDEVLDEAEVGGEG